MRQILAPRSGGKPVAEINRYSGNLTDYQTVVSYTVAAGRTGLLFEVSMVTDQFTKTQFKLTVAGVVLFQDIIIQAPLSLPFPPAELAAGNIVLLECKSTDGTAIVVDGSITGSEI